jgi:hypothetical protein
MPQNITQILESKKDIVDKAIEIVSNDYDEEDMPDIYKIIAEFELNDEIYSYENHILFEVCREIFENLGLVINSTECGSGGNDKIININTKELRQFIELEKADPLFLLKR